LDFSIVLFLCSGVPLSEGFRERKNSLTFSSSPKRWKDATVIDFMWDYVSKRPLRYWHRLTGYVPRSVPSSWQLSQDTEPFNSLHQNPEDEIKQAA
jgi:hypothetical protein